MSGKDMIYGSVLLIEHRLAEELSIGELAGQSFFSRTHYKRLFQAVMGEPVMEYIKRRRLQRAGMALCETDLSVLEIALQFGYTSHEGFSRAFKAHFGMPPLQYRKRYAAVRIDSYHKEVVNMITSEARKNITKYTDEIMKELEALAASLEQWTLPAQREIEKAGRTAGGMKVAFKEWVNLTERISFAKFEIQKIPAETESVYDLFDKAEKMMKVFADIIFQMDLLRFLTGVELSRMGEHKAPFEPIVKGITELCESENNRNDASVKLVLEVKAQVQAEIKREAIGCAEQSAEALREAVSEGALLSEKLNALVIKLGANGRGFALVAKETEKAVACVREAEASMTQFARNGDITAGNPFVFIGKVQADGAFQMNLNSFNAAVESARAGDSDDCIECVQGTRDYAWTIQRAVIKCVEISKEYGRLAELLKAKEADAKAVKDANTGSQLSHRHLDEIIFRIKFFNTQLYLESERTSQNSFLGLSRDFEKALEYLMNDPHRKDIAGMLSAFSKGVSALIERGKAEAETAGKHGAGIAYILEEYEKFISRLLVTLPISAV